MASVYFPDEKPILLTLAEIKVTPSFNFTCQVDSLVINFNQSFWLGSSE